MSETVGIYAGSFDPVTNGHLDIINRACNLFDKVVIAIGINPSKKYTFSPEDRVEMIKTLYWKQIRSHSMTVSYMHNDFLVHYAKSVGATHIIRGIRSHKDFDDESLMQRINKEIDPSVETVFFVPNKEFIDVSSSLVKALTGPKYWHFVVRNYVPINVLYRLAHMEFHKACRKMNLNEASTEKIWGKYGVYPRQYHNPLHILDVLSDMNVYENLFCDDIMAASYAILLHDVEDTEKESVEFFKSNSFVDQAFPTFQPPWVRKEFEEKVEGLIMATDHSRTDFDVFSNDQELVHDFDLMILASNSEVYKSYSKSVQQESMAKYEISEEEYREKRIEFLEKLMDRNNLFLHREFNSLNEKAKSNMEEEINRLRGK